MSQQTEVSVDLRAIVGGYCSDFDEDCGLFTPEEVRRCYAYAPECGECPLLTEAQSSEGGRE